MKNPIANSSQALDIHPLMLGFKSWWTLGRMKHILLFALGGAVIPLAYLWGLHGIEIADEEVKYARASIAGILGIELAILMWHLLAAPYTQNRLVLLRLLQLEQVTEARCADLHRVISDERQVSQRARDELAALRLAITSATGKDDPLAAIEGLRKATSDDDRLARAKALVYGPVLAARNACSGGLLVAWDDVHTHLEGIGNVARQFLGPKAQDTLQDLLKASEIDLGRRGAQVVLLDHIQKIEDYITQMQPSWLRSGF